MEKRENRRLGFLIFLVFLSALVRPETLPADNRSHTPIQSPLYLEKKAGPLIWPRNINPVHVVVVFTRFEGEKPEDTLAPQWAENLFDGFPGSIPHFFDTVSFGQYRVTGEFLPKMYVVPPYDNMYEYSDAVVQLLINDPDVDFSRYDNDGRDGISNSDDDDGYVDYLVLMPRSRPYNFISQLATGVMYLGTREEFKTNTRRPDGSRILIDYASGCICTALTKNQAVGTIDAELCHAFGAVDLMDKIYVDPANDSAGIGFWGILGRGALGWDGKNGPVGPCAYNRMLMSSVGPSNSNLIDLYGINLGVRMKDTGSPDGKIYRLPFSQSEYFLLEFRNNHGANYYDRTIPQSGLLIWHIIEGNSNCVEMEKLCDLESPDGRFIDKGYPLGKNPDPLKGGDNLDFWSRDSNYAAKFAGNQGDATDVYDGVTYTMFGSKTNPNSYSHVTNRPTGIEIVNIRREGDEMVFDCYVPPYPDRMPGPAPPVGLAYQRNTDTSGYDLVLTGDKEFYLVSFGSGCRADAIITVTRDSLYVEPIEFEIPQEAEKALAAAGSGYSRQQGGFQIVRRFISNEEFTRIVGGYGFNPENYKPGGQLNWVQKIISISGDTEARILSIDLRQNYPNPFNGHTTIPYILPAGGSPVIEVYNILGQRVLLLDRGHEGPGYHETSLNASQLPSGVYLYRLSGCGFSLSRRFTLVK